MRELYYRMYDANGFKAVAKTLAEANKAKADGCRVETVLEEQPKAEPKMTDKKRARRVKAVKP